MLTRNYLGVTVLLVVLCSTSNAWADPIQEAKRLKEEAQLILRKQSGLNTAPKTYAAAVIKLEKAEALLEEVAKTDPKAVEGLQEDVTASLFWARRFTTLNIADELRKNRPASKPENKGPETGKPPVDSGQPKTPDSKVKTPATPPAPKEPAKPYTPPKRPPVATAKVKPPTASEAESAFNKALAYESSHPGEEHAIALRWFQMADQFSGTEWSLKGLARAREAQRKFQDKQREAELSKTDDGKLIVEGNRLLDQSKFKEALAKFQAAKRVKTTVLAERMIGNTFKRVGYNLRDTFAKKYLALLKQYQEAQRMRDRGRLAMLSRQRHGLSQMEKDVLHCYKKAMEAYVNGLRIADGKDLECEANIGILYFQKKNPIQARMYLSRVLDKYEPQNDGERTVYEFSRSLLKRLGG